jgi:glutaredoxin
MSNYYIKAISLKGCPYSKKAELLLKEYNIDSDIIHIDYNEKNNFITDLIKTFPQIYLKKYNSNGNLLLGGYNDLNSFINKFNKNTIFSENDINNFIYEKKWSKKATLRLIELINLNF